MRKYVKKYEDSTFSYSIEARYNKYLDIQSNPDNAEQVSEKDKIMFRRKKSALIRYIIDMYKKHAVDKGFPKGFP